MDDPQIELDLNQIGLPSILPVCLSFFTVEYNCVLNIFLMIELSFLVEFNHQNTLKNNARIILN